MIAYKQTSLDAYYSLKHLGAKQQRVYSLLEESRPLCNLDIATRLGVPINQITPRTNELVAKDMVEEAYRDVNPSTGKRVIYWTTRKEQ